MDSHDYEQSDEPPMPDVFDEDTVNELQDFLSKAGGVMLLDELATGAERFVTLDQTLDMSSATLRDRLDQADELDLVEVEIRTQDDEGRKYWKLTDRGEVIREEIQKTDLVRIQKRIRELQHEFDGEVDSLLAQMKARTDEMNEKYGKFLIGGG
ncbi:hypothetical protein [Natrinema hispanicum]|nr:hypothetical protein [Natrinema hispanicum]